MCLRIILSEYRKGLLIHSVVIVTRATMNSSASVGFDIKQSVELAPLFFSQKARSPVLLIFFSNNKKSSRRLNPPG